MTIAAAILGRDAAALPGRRDEDWRWTDLRGLIRAVPAPAPKLSGQISAGPFDRLAERVVALGAGDAESLHVAPGEAAVLAVRFIARGGGSHVSELSVEVGAGGRLTLLESYEGEGADYLAHASLNLTLAEGASLERIVLARDDAEGVRISQARVLLAPGARFAQTTIATGARRQRLETRVAHPGGGASVRMDGLYALDGQRHCDITTEVIHALPDGTTQQLTKGVVRDRARAVFQGRIVVAHGADRTDARMGHHALISGDRAEVNAKPELEIFADDVACAHGNTVGRLDEDALFYARQRGMPEAVARAMLTEAFLGEVVDRIGHDGARDVVRAWVAERLG